MPCAIYAAMWCVLGPGGSSYEVMELAGVCWQACARIATQQRRRPCTQWMGLGSMHPWSVDDPSRCIYTPLGRKAPNPPKRVSFGAAFCLRCLSQVLPSASVVIVVCAAALQFVFAGDGGRCSSLPRRPGGW
jgi:hypothetical protein